MIETKNLTKLFPLHQGLFGRKRSGKFAENFPGVNACVNVSFDIKKGEIFGLVGESGSGKSTVAKLILLLLKPTEGKILIDGQDAADISGRRALADVRRKIQYVPQNSGGSLNPHMTLEQIIMEPALNFGLKPNPRELLEIVGLSPDWLRRRPAKLSGGQRQRAAIARAISINPKALVLDEVTSSLDVITSIGIIKTLGDINREFNASMLLITHDISLADRFCQRIGVMKDGKLVEITDDLTKTENIYAKELVDSSLALYKK